MTRQRPCPTPAAHLAFLNGKREQKPVGDAKRFEADRVPPLTLPFVRARLWPVLEVEHDGDEEVDEHERKASDRPASMARAAAS